MLRNSFSIKGLATIFLLFMPLGNLSAAELPALVSGDELESIKGATVNRNSSIGSNSSLTVGSSTTFGASVNLNASEGTGAKTSSLLKLNTLGADPQGALGLKQSCPTGGCLRTSVGGDDSTLRGKIVNIKATNSTTINENVLDSESNSLGTGDVDFTGISGQNNLVLDPTSQFEVETYTLGADDSDGTLAGETSSGGSFTRVSSAGSSATIDTSTNAEIKSTDFISTFQQAF